MRGKIKINKQLAIWTILDNFLSLLLRLENWILQQCTVSSPKFVLQYLHLRVLQCPLCTTCTVVSSVYCVYCCVFFVIRCTVVSILCNTCHVYLNVDFVLHLLHVSSMYYVYCSVYNVLYVLQCLMYYCAEIYCVLDAMYCLQKYNIL